MMTPGRRRGALPRFRPVGDDVAQYTRALTRGLGDDGGFIAHCEISPGGFQTSTFDTQAQARAYFEQCKAGKIQLDPARPGAKCGWYGPAEQPVMTASFAKDGYTCRPRTSTLQNGTAITATAAGAPLRVLAPAPPARRLSTAAKVGLGAAAAGLLYLVVK
jgi:hypothetical protein